MGKAYSIVLYAWFALYKLHVGVNIHPQQRKEVICRPVYLTIVTQSGESRRSAVIVKMWGSKQFIITWSL